MKSAFFLPVILFVLNVSAQFETVDREQIKQQVTDQSAASYYPNLLQRFNNNDFTLTLADYRALYYGFVFQPAYSGYADHQKKQISEAISNHNYTEAVRVADEVLQRIPVSLTANYLKGYALFKIDSTDNSWVTYRKKYTSLRDAIISSGDGLSCATAFKTIFVTDEYDIMYNYFEISSRSSQQLVYPCDKFTIDPSKYFQAKEIFFDTSESMRSLRKR